MTDPTEPGGGDRRPSAELPQPVPRRRLLRRMILRNTAALPALATLLNGIAGFASVYYATKDGLAGGAVPNANLTLAAWMIFAAMVFDAIDGRLARMTRQATDFGAQLDSMCDVISFGVAPAVLMIYAVAMTRQIQDFDVFASRASVLGKVVVAIAVIYLCCSVLRLARFNIENAPDLLRHMYFKGLPSPGAAATVAALVLLFEHLQHPHVGLRSAAWLNVTVGVSLPAVTLAVSLLMISRFRYPHVVNRFIAGRRPFGYIAWLVVMVILAWVFLQMTMAAAALAYAGSGPMGALIRRIRLRRRLGQGH